MNKEADYGLTAQAFDTNLGNDSRFAHDDHLYVNFEEGEVIDIPRSNEEGRPIYKDVDMITIMTPGNKLGIVKRKVTEQDKRRFAAKYKEYKELSSDSESISGTRLEDWPGATRSIVAELRHLHIRTVEQLANVSDSNAQGVMGMQMLKQKARDWLENNSNSDKQLAEARKEMEEMKAQMAEMMGMIEEKTNPDNDASENEDQEILEES